MSLFEEKDNTNFNEEDKIRLFETQKRSERSIKDYAKVLLPIAVVAVVLVGSILYLIQPGIGDAVKAPKELEDRVYDYMLAKEKRTASEMTFYKCDGYYWVKVLAEPRSYPPSLLLDAVNQYRLKASPSGESSWQVETLSLPSKEDDVPCRR